MAERIPIIEDPEANERLSAEIATWGGLTDVDRYDSRNTPRYDALIELAREHVGQSLVAAALVSARDGDVESSHYDFGFNIQSALDTAEKVRSMQAFAEENPEDVGLHFGEYHLILFKFAEMEMAPYYIPNSPHHAFVSVDAPLQTEVMLHGGQVSRSVQASNHSEQGVRGGYQWFSATFNEIRNGTMPTIAQMPVPPLTFGREAVADYFAKQAFTESVHAGTNHRLKSLAYGTWLVRHEDERLASKIDETCEAVGLVNLWTEQYRKEIGAKAAHLLLSKQAPVSRLQRLRQIELIEPRWFNDEPSIFGDAPEIYVEFAQQQAKRIGVDADEVALKDALMAVFSRLEG